MATWSVIAEMFTTSEAVDTTYFQGIKPINDLVITGLRPTIMNFNDPMWTSAVMKIYSYSGGSIRGLIATSTNTISKTSIFSDNSGFGSCLFEFANISIKSGDTVAAVLNFNGYSGSDSSWVGWVVGWPDPIYRTNINNSYESLLVNPYSLEVIGYDI